MSLSFCLKTSFFILISLPVLKEAATVGVLGPSALHTEPVFKILEH